jgi:hypothetical protein
MWLKNKPATLTGDPQVSVAGLFFNVDNQIRLSEDLLYWRFTVLHIKILVCLPY